MQWLLAAESRLLPFSGSRRGLAPFERNRGDAASLPSCLRAIAEAIADLRASARLSQASIESGRRDGTTSRCVVRQSPICLWGEPADSIETPNVPMHNDNTSSKVGECLGDDIHADGLGRATVATLMPVLQGTQEPERTDEQQYQREERRPEPAYGSER